MSLDAIVRDYVQRFRAGAQRELKWFQEQSALTDAIFEAALARDERGKRYSHQSRRQEAVLEKAAERLICREADLASANSFAVLLQVIESALEPISDLGPLYKYDTTLRIGAFLGLSPEVVYLHSGTAEGAKALGFKGRPKFLLISELPAPLRQLAPYEVEDVLCIYKKQLGAALSGRDFDLPTENRCFLDEELE